MTPIHARCLSCGHTWITALVDPQSWWGKGLDVRKVARQMSCPTCDGPSELAEAPKKASEAA